MAGGIGGGISGSAFGSSDFSISFQFSPHVPRYGNYCGPGWTGGIETKGGETDQELYSARPVDAIDALCMAHDKSYGYAERLMSSDPNRGREILNTADQVLSSGVVTILAQNHKDQIPLPEPLGTSLFLSQNWYPIGVVGIFSVMPLTSGRATNARPIVNPVSNPIAESWYVDPETGEIIHTTTRIMGPSGGDGSGVWVLQYIDENGVAHKTEVVSDQQMAPDVVAQIRHAALNAGGRDGALTALQMNGVGGDAILRTAAGYEGTDLTSVDLHPEVTQLGA